MGKKIRNLIGTLLLVTAIVVTQIPVTDVEAVETASASDFQMDGTTLVKYTGTAENVSVSNYVKKIESEAFAGNDNVKSVKIGENVEEIGSRAFADCVNLQSVIIPDSVEVIDNAAFAGCEYLTKVTVGKGLNSLGNGVFAGTYSLQEVDFDSSNPKFTCNEGAVYNKDGLDTLYQVLAGRAGDTYSMPSTVKTIKPYAFWGDYHLQTVHVSSNVSELPGYCFSNCKNLKNVEIPYSVVRIDMKAFEDCVRLRELTIPPSVGTIHSTAFDGCTRMELLAEPGSYAEKYAQELVLEDIEVSEYEESPVEKAKEAEDASVSENTADLLPVDYYHEVTHMNPMEEDEDASVRGVTRIIGQQAFVMIDNASAAVNVGSTGEVLGGSQEGVVIPAQAYYDGELVQTEFPENTQRIGEFSFARSRLTSVTIPDGVTEIGYGAFYHCDALSEVGIPASVTSVESFAFAKTPWLQSWLDSAGEGSDFLIVGDGILLAYRGNVPRVEIPQEVKQIGPDVFREHGEITEVVIPDSVKIVGEAAFMDCTALTQLRGMNQTESIRDRAFAGCPIQNIRIPASVKEIGLRAFDVSESGKAEENGVVVFEGASLPLLRYGTSATKLYHDSYRDYAFKGNSIAVISETASIDNKGEGTVLEASRLGFDGSVCRISKEPDEDGAGILQEIYSCGNQQSAGKTFYIDGLAYEVESAQTDGTDEADQQAADSVSEESEAEIFIESESANLAQDGWYHAAVEGAEHSYLLQINDSDSAGAQIKKAYQAQAEAELPERLQGYELNLSEKQTGIPITSLGRLTMLLQIPVPQGLDPDSMHVLCLNSDGLLKELECHVVSVDGADCLQMETKYFPYYAVYSDKSDENVIAEGEVQLSEGRMVFEAQGQRVEDTAEHDVRVFAKWMLAGVLFCSSMCVYLLGNRFQRRKKRASAE